MKRNALAVAVCLISGLTVSAQSGRPLPIFELTDLAGGVVRSVDVVPEGQALLVFIQNDCRACDTLLRSIKKDKIPAVPAKMVVIVGGASVSELKALKARFPDLEEAAWFADTSWAGWNPLGLSGMPIVDGVRERVLDWRLTGAQPEARVASILGTWVARPVRPPQE